MTSIKLKFRPSSVDGKEGSIYYQIIHNRKVRQLHTDYRILPEEWDETEENIIIRGYNSDRVNLLTNIRERINWDISRMKRTFSQQANIGTFFFRLHERCNNAITPTKKSPHIGNLFLYTQEFYDIFKRSRHSHRWNHLRLDAAIRVMVKT